MVVGVVMDDTRISTGTTGTSSIAVKLAAIVWTVTSTTATALTSTPSALFLFVF